MKQMFCPRDFFPLSFLVIMRSRKVSEYLYDVKQIYSHKWSQCPETGITQVIKELPVEWFHNNNVILVTTGRREGQDV